MTAACPIPVRSITAREALIPTLGHDVLADWMQALARGDYGPERPEFGARRGLVFDHELMCGHRVEMLEPELYRIHCPKCAERGHRGWHVEGKKFVAD